MRKTIIEVYRDVIKNAGYWDDEAAKIDKFGGARKELCETVAHELYKVAADMEHTIEINPPVNI